MTQGPCILAIDEGTTLVRAMVFDAEARAVALAAEPLPQIYPRPGWVEHDAETIWRLVLTVGRQAIEAAGRPEIAAIGITNQRETTLIWERDSGRPIANAIVWQDRRTEPICEDLRRRGLAAHVSATTGLVIDPYFSATKLAWLLERPGVRARAEAGALCFGTIDSWLVFRLTGGKTHATDATNASRTLLFDIRSGQWDRALLDALAIPAALLPDVRDCQADFGVSEAEHFGTPIPILGIAGDQQAATFGQACFAPGGAKATYGTGCFLVVNTGERMTHSASGLLSTIAYQLAGRRTYALEGAIFMAGATIQWLRDNLGLFADVRETAAMAEAADADSGVYLVPAFQGLGAPHWDARARGALLGLSRASGRNEVVRAGLESVAFQTRDLMDAIARDMAAAGLAPITVLRADGGMTANTWLMQTIADIIGMPVEVPDIAETTALGAALHAGLAAGLYGSLEEAAGRWRLGRRYEPVMADAQREQRYAGWLQAVERVRTR